MFCAPLGFIISRHRGRSVLLGFLALALPWLIGSCDPYSDLKESLPLLDPTNTRFNTPGRQLLAGTFVELLPPKTDESGLFVAARAVRGERSFLRMASWENGANPKETTAEAQCETPEFTTLLPGLFSERTQVLDDPDGDGFGTFTAYNSRCGEAARAEDVRPLISAYWFSTFYILERKAGGLSIYDGEAIRDIEGTTDAEVVSANNLDLWVRRPNSLTNYSLESLKVVDTLDVSASVAIIDRETNALLFRDKSGFHYRVNKTTFDLGDSLCEPLLTQGRIFSLDPCSERRLRIDTFANAGGKQIHTTKTSLSPVAGAPLEARVGSQGAVLLATKSASFEQEIHVVRLLEGSVSITEFPSEGRLLDSMVHFLADFDGDSGALWEVGDTSVTHLADGATSVSPVSGCALLAHVNFKNGLTDLVCFDAESGAQPSSVTIAKGVTPPHLIRAERARRGPLYSYAGSSDGLVVSQAKNFIGDLSRIESLSSPPSLKRINSQVSALQYATMVNPDGVAYLKANGDTTNLEVWLEYADLIQPIHENVVAFQVTAVEDSPVPGILYLVSSGKDAGLWFTKAQ